MKPKSQVKIGCPFSSENGAVNSIVQNNGLLKSPKKDINEGCLASQINKDAIPAADVGLGNSLYLYVVYTLRCLLR